MSTNAGDVSAAERLKAAATGKELQKEKTFPQMLDALKIQVAAALPKHLTADRMTRIALTAFRLNPKLAECDPKSVCAAVVVSAQLGLEVGVLGQAYLVPYYDKKKRKLICQLIPGWQGLVDLVNRSGRASVWTGAVYEGDDFEFQYGSDPYLNHRPSGNDDVGKLTHVYAIGRVKGAEFPVMEVWPVAKVIRHRDRYNKVGDNHYSYTDDNNFEMYARKVALLQVLKYMPKSIENLEHALHADAAAESGRIIDLAAAGKGDFVPNPDDGDEPGPDYTNAPLAIAYLKEASDEQTLQLRWKEVAAAFEGKEMPVDIEAVKHDRAAVFEQASAKGKK